ncbi:restriction endonuclease [Variovorax sp. 350MFTsu5.1]|uniref:restriction endonuclease n=1 Tax=Variovorax sp. 350MFTsu5.1 TaxID=3158365 RepID=UPI003AAA2E47
MSIWVHGEQGATPSIGEICGAHCRFCKTQLVREEIEDRWIGVSNTYERQHREYILAMAECHGDFLLRDLEYTAPPREEPACLCICPLCGWWNVSKEIYLETGARSWFVEFGAAASLRKFGDIDICAPVNEVRQYLAARYEKRYLVNPRCFEEVVASVFASHGLDSEVTQYSSDGGIDIVLRNAQNQATAVQVKRHRGAIEVSAIREFLGAMVLNGHTQGVFVTTSRFQSGCEETAKRASRLGTAMQLVDGTAFLQHLRQAQLHDFFHYRTLIDNEIIQSLELQFGGEYHEGSL